MTDTAGWFDDVPVLGMLPRDLAAAKLTELGDFEAAEELSEQTPGSFGLWRATTKPWQHTSHAFGHVARSGGPPGDQIKVTSASAIGTDDALRSKRIKITLDGLRVAGYPGRGIHRILFDFYAQNQLAKGVEHLHFNATFRAQEGEGVAVLGYPLFVGLHVGTEGVAFKCFTVNVKNDDDEAFLGFLEGDAFRSGLHLVSSLQPAIAPLSATALAITKAVAKRHRNVAVQEFYLGLDFSNLPFRARLSEGSYIAVQIPETLKSVWSWDDWVYLPARGQLVSAADRTTLIPYNYLIFGVSRYDG